MKANTGTIFKVFLLNQSSPYLQQGFVKLWKHKGKLVDQSKPIPFNHYDEIGSKIRKLLKAEGIEWPTKSK